MTDLQVLVIAALAVVVLLGISRAMRPGAGMNVIDVLAAIAVVFGFIYLAWALLRPEDF